MNTLSLDNITSLKNLFEVLEGTQGSYDKESENFIALKDDTQIVLNKIHNLALSIVKTNPHFSVEERNFGLKILEKLEVLKKEAQKNYDSQQNLFYRIIGGGRSVESGFGPFAGYDNLPDYFRSYTKNQWSAIHPNEPIPRNWNYSQWRDEPGRYAPI